MNDGGKFEIHANEDVPGTIAPAVPAPVSSAAEVAALMRGEADAPIVVNCPDGRVFTLKRLGWLDQMRLAKALGAELTANEQYYGLAVLAAMVSEINGKAPAALINADWVEARMQQIGDVGFTAIAERMAALAAEAKKAATAAMIAGEIPADAETTHQAKVKNY